jgi:thioredoxin 1
MVSRRSVLAGLAACVPLAIRRAWADVQPFTPELFHAAQEADKPILIVIHATWCTTCAAQKPILSQLMEQPRFKELVVLRIDFDTQKDAVRSLQARKQSTLIVFKGPTEIGRSIADTKADSIAALLAKAI